MARKKISSEKIETADRLRCLRERMGCTQEVFANKLNVSLSAYKKIESAENNVSLNVLRKLNEMDVSSDFILFGTQTDVDGAWRAIQRCSEEDKLYLCIMMILHFVEKKGYSDKTDIDAIFEMIKKITQDKEI
ncbi:MAG: helix-turn-helix transcriptional regulator [Lachnospiraceae bacterium]|nr:helix-turn-helix transcriptional regulator [Lachnospiraceae bacterium]